MSSSRPLLVTGLPRSGTSWVGKMLEAGGQVVYINEPLNPQHPPGRSPGVLNAPVTHRFMYICADNEEPWLTAFSDTVRLRYHPVAELRQNRSMYDLARMSKYGRTFTVGRLKDRRPLLDDPFALFSTPWLVDRIGCSALVLVRDPVAFVGSWRKLGWTVQFHELLEQPLLMRDHLEPFREQMRAMIGSTDVVARICLLWRIAHTFVDEVLRPLPQVHIRTYESLVTGQVAGFREVYDALSLDWNGRAADAVARAGSDHGAVEKSHSWSLRGGLSRTAYHPMSGEHALSTFRDRLSVGEIDRVRELTRDVADRFFDQNPST